MDFAVSVDHSVKIKQSEKRDKYIDFARELIKNKLWTMKVTVISSVVGAFGTISKGLEDLETRDHLN